MSSSEHSIQNAGRNALAGRCINFRANVGKAWVGEATRLSNGDILLKNPRPFDSGLPKGFSDTFGITPVKITQEMVGITLGVFHAIEYKTPTGKPTPEQETFLKAVIRNGGRAGVARSAEDAVKIALG